MLREIVEEMNEAKSGMVLGNETRAVLKGVSKKTKTDGNIYGWKWRKGASIPGNYEEKGIPTSSSPKDILKASNSKNHIFFVMKTNGDVIVSDPNWSETLWLLKKDDVEGQEVNFKRNFIEGI